MKRLVHSMKKHLKVQASTESALTTSAALPSSGFTFVDNSQGASAAVAELSRSLDTALDQIKLEGNADHQISWPCTYCTTARRGPKWAAQPADAETRQRSLQVPQLAAERR
jgi:hypothetical protein